MRILKHAGLIFGLLAGLVLDSRPAAAQYSADFQTNIISGVVSNWSGPYIVGNTNYADVLLIQNSGVLSNGSGCLGCNTGSSNNAASVTGTGSFWRSFGPLAVGSSSASNTLVISNGGQVFSSAGNVGAGFNYGSNIVVISGTGSVWNCQGVGAPGSFTFGGSSGGNSLMISNGAQFISGRTQIGREGSSNSILVAGSGSVWTNSGNLILGGGGGLHDGNSMLIADSAQVFNNSAFIGMFNGTSNNSVLITGAGSVWKNSGTISIGDLNLWDNSLAVSGGTVFASNVWLACHNVLEVDDGSVIITNAAGNAALQVHGKLILNGGTLQVNQIVMTDSCAQFVRTGGTLIYDTAVLDPNANAVGDGIPNGWKQQYNLDPLDPSVANADADGDGFSNWQEYLAGTDPTNSTSALRIIAFAREGNDLRVTWTMGNGKTNALQAVSGSGGFSTNAFADIFTATNTTGGLTNYLDVGAATNTPSRFYRVRLAP